jgi:uncharacterized protein YbjT (DUF2867 family)
MTERNVASVVGASGVVGGHLAALLATQADWRVLGLSRSATPRNGITPIAADQRSIDAVRGALVLGPFEAYGQGHLPPTPFREDQGRLDVDNSAFG